MKQRHNSFFSLPVLFLFQSSQRLLDSFFRLAFFLSFFPQPGSRGAAHSRLDGVFLDKLFVLLVGFELQVVGHALETIANQRAMTGKQPVKICISSNGEKHVARRHPFVLASVQTSESRLVDQFLANVLDDGREVNRSRGTDARRVASLLHPLIEFWNGKQQASLAGLGARGLGHG